MNQKHSIKNTSTTKNTIDTLSHLPLHWALWGLSYKTYPREYQATRRCIMIFKFHVFWDWWEDERSGFGADMATDSNMLGAICFGGMDRPSTAQNLPR